MKIYKTRKCKIFFFFRNRFSKTKKKEYQRLKKIEKKIVRTQKMQDLKNSNVKTEFFL